MSNLPSRQTSTFLVLASLCGLVSCAPTQSNNLALFRSNFLPPSPRPAEAAESPQQANVEQSNLEPPSVAPGAFVNDAPVFLVTEPRVPPRPQLDVRIRQSEESFQAGPVCTASKHQRRGESGAPVFVVAEGNDAQNRSAQRQAGDFNCR